MREVGFVKWFGGHNYRTGKPNDYGFIERKDKPDVYFHKSGLLASEVRISQGTVVSFMSREVGRGTKQEAVAVKLLQDEEDRGVLEYCAWSNDGRLVSKVVERYLSGIPSEDWHKAEDYILRKLANPSYARYLPLETLVKLSRMLNNLDPRARLDLLLKTVERASGSEVDRQIAYGVVDAILALAPDRRAVYWKRLPYALYDNDPALRMKIPLDLHIQCAIRALEPNSTTERDLLFDELRSRLSASPAKSSWSLVPDALLSQAPLWEAAPPNRKVKYLYQSLLI